MTRFVRIAFLVAACGPVPVPHSTTPPPRVMRAPQSLDEALVENDLERVSLPVRQRSPGSISEPMVRDHTLTVSETSSTIFARRRDGAIVIVRPHPTLIFDQPGPSARSTGGHDEVEEVEQVDYALPEGETFGGVIDVGYEQHVVEPMFRLDYLTPVG
jgi:hypothetical protein